MGFCHDCNMGDKNQSELLGSPTKQVRARKSKYSPFRNPAYSLFVSYNYGL